MKKEPIISRIFRTLFAVVFCIALAAVLIAIPLYSTVGAIARPEKLASMMGDVIRETDLDTLVELPDEVEIADQTINTTVAKDILNHQVTKDILGDCTEAMIKTYAIDSEADFTTSHVEDILTDNLDDLAAMVKDKFPSVADLPVEEVKQQLTVKLPAISEKVMDNLPAKEEIKQLVGTTMPAPDTDADVNEESTVTPPTVETPGENISTEGTDSALEALATVRSILSPATGYILYGSVALLALLVLLCRFKNLNGLMWIGIDDLLVGAILLAVTLIVSSSQLLVSLVADQPALQSLLSSAISVVLSPVRTTAIVLLVLGVVLIVANIVYVAVKRKKVADQPVPAIAE